MPRKEVPLQYEMFTGELVDTRLKRQKQRARQNELPQQAEMFSSREVLQFGVKARPKLPLSPATRLELAMEDRRTEEEMTHDRQRAAEENTVPMFAPPGENISPELFVGEDTCSVYGLYDELRRRYPLGIMFFRLGADYQTFNGDAEIAAHELGLALTNWQVGDFTVTMAGTSRHTLDEDIYQLVERGYYVVVCDYTGAEPVNGVIPREVVQVVRAADNREK